MFCLGPIYDTKIIYDATTGNSRGFGFIYFEYLEDAIAARRACNGICLHGRRIRVDYSITRRPHSPTPGVYMGLRSKSHYRREESSYYRSSTHRRHSRHSSHYRSRSRSP